uniref:DUF6598 domain-containing protein n=1 Tax=Oryza meridionalis TaxID=40149 RepID=A0A0E0EHI1_9ORYZ
MARESERSGMVIDDVGGGGLNLPIVAGKRKRELTWEEKAALTVLDIPAERDCSLIDSEKDYSSKLARGPPIKSLAFPDYWWEMDSVNVIAIKVAESDVGYPIRVFGTVLARDEYDFRRDRNNPQIITSPEDTLTLTGPNRALGATDKMYFEFNLKIRDDGDVDKDFCKGVREHNAICYTKQPMTLSLESCLSTIDFVYSPVQLAVEASVAVKIKGVVSTFFTGKVTAWTTGDDQNKIILYDSEVEGSNRVVGADGSVDLTRCFVAVNLDDELVLNVCVSEGAGSIFELVLGHNDEECVLEQGPYELQVNVVWTAALKHRQRRKLFERIAKLARGPPIKSLAFPDYWWEMDSVNVIAIKVAESDVGYPIRVFGTVLARDEYDFRRDRNNPQIITSPEDTLTLTGPNRALGATDKMYFEFNLKIRDDGDVDKDFCKGVREHNAICYTKQPMTLSLESCLSTIDFVYSPVQLAVEASVAVKIKGVVSTFFTGKVTAWTTGDDQNKIILYDSEVEGSNRVVGADGSVDLTRCFVAVNLDDELVLNVCVSEGAGSIFELVLGHNDEECVREQGPYELQVNVVWTAAFKHRQRRKLFERIGDFRVLR